MTIYLLDTHALYWHLFGPAKLSAAAKQAIAEGEAGQALLIVSHVVLAELFFLLRKLGEDAKFSNIVAAILSNANYRIDSIVLNDILGLADFPEITEMHDRLIALAAKRLGAAIVTKDRAIQASAQVSCVW